MSNVQGHRHHRKNHRHRNKNKQQQRQHDCHVTMTFIDTADYIVERLSLKDFPEVEIVFEHNDKLWQDDDNWSMITLVSDSDWLDRDYDGDIEDDDDDD